MTVARQRPETAERREALPPIAERVRSVANQLEPLLDQKNRQLLQVGLEKAVRLAEKLRDPEPEKSLGVAWEKAALLLALTIMVGAEGRNGNDILPVLTQIYRFKSEQRQPEKLRRKTLTDKKSLAIRQLLLESGFQLADVSNEFVRRVERDFPDSPQDVINAIAQKTVQETLRKLIATGRFFEDNDPNKPLLRLPLTKAQAVTVMKDSYQSLDDAEEATFGGIAVLVPLVDGSRLSVPILFADSSPVMVQHERNHRDFPGLLIGGLRMALNEAVTDLLAEQISGEQMRKTGYKSEADLLEWTGKNIGSLLVARYQSDTVQNSRVLAVALINEFGFSGYVELFQANPSYKKTDEQLALQGKRRTEVVLESLRKQTSLFGTFRRRF